MTPTGYASYRNVMANTTESKEKILLMLYEGALTFVRAARRGIEERNPRIKGENISKILGILTELDCALDREKGGDLAGNIADLYRYLINLLTTANINNDPEALDEVERLLGELYEGFQGAAQKKPTGMPAQPEMEEPCTQGGISLAV